MRNLWKVVALCVVIFAFLSGTAAAQSNAAPSLKVGLNPNCKVANALSLTANVTANIGTADVCNISASATSIHFYVTVSAASSGTLKLWERDGTEPGFGVISYPSGTSSFFADVRTGRPLFEVDGIAAESTSNISLTLVPSAYFIEP